MCIQYVYTPNKRRAAPRKPPQMPHNPQSPPPPTQPPSPPLGAAPRAQCGAALSLPPPPRNASPRHLPRPLPPDSPSRLAFGVSRQLCRLPPPTVPTPTPTTIYLRVASPGRARGRSWLGTPPPPLGRRRRFVAPSLGALSRLARTAPAARAQCSPPLRPLGLFLVFSRRRLAQRLGVAGPPPGPPPPTHPHKAPRGGTSNPPPRPPPPPPPGRAPPARPTEFTFRTPTRPTNYSGKLV